MRSLRPLRLVAGLCALAGLVALSAPLRERVGSLLDAGSHVTVAFTRTSPTGLVTWRTCGPIPVLVNPGPGGAAATAEIVAALEEVTVLTGLRFTVAGTELVPRSDWAVSAPASGAGFAPVLIGWVDPSATDLLRPGAAGATVANPAVVAGVRQIVTGAIALDAGQYEAFGAAGSSGKTRRNLLLHEIGHLLGLDHAHGPGLMDPVVGRHSPDGFHPAEVAALARAYAACAR